MLKETQMNPSHMPWLDKAMEEQGIDCYTVKEDGVVLVPDTVSNRRLKTIRRRMYAFYLTATTGVRHLTRDDLHGKEGNMSGVVIPSEEEYFGIR